MPGPPSMSRLGWADQPADPVGRSRPVLRRAVAAPPDRRIGKSEPVASLPLPIGREPLQQGGQGEVRRLPPVEDRLHDVGREQRQPQDSVPK